MKHYTKEQQETILDFIKENLSGQTLTNLLLNGIVNWFDNDELFNYFDMLLKDGKISFYNIKYSSLSKHPAIAPKLEILEKNYSFDTYIVKHLKTTNSTQQLYDIVNELSLKKCKSQTNNYLMHLIFRTKYKLIDENFIKFVYDKFRSSTIKQLCLRSDKCPEYCFAKATLSKDIKTISVALGSNTMSDKMSDKTMDELVRLWVAHYPEENNSQYFYEKSFSKKAKLKISQLREVSDILS